MAELVSIELLLDAATEARVRDEWMRLAEAGLSSLGRHPSPSNRLHVTLLVRPTLPALTFETAIGMLPVPVVLGALTVFVHGDRGVLVRPLMRDQRLDTLHRAVHDAAPPGDDAAHTVPGAWTPHVTLARRLRLAELDRARELLGDGFDGEGIALRRWDAASATVTDLG